MRKGVKDPLLVILVILLIILLVLERPSFVTLTSLINWKTILNLLAILLSVKGLELSGFLTYVASKIISSTRSLRKLALVYVCTVFTLAPVVTNDISLLVMVPLLSSIACTLERDLSDLAVLSSVAANVGSSLTPIGNPQNLIIFHHYHIPFITFVLYMAVPVLVMFLLLIAFTYIMCKEDTISLTITKIKSCKYNRKLALTSIIMLAVIILILATPLRHVYCIAYILAAVSIIVFTLVDVRVLRYSDWNLLAIILLMFLDFGLISHMCTVEALIRKFMKSPIEIYFFSIGLSQIMSNVPATVLLINLVNNYVPLMYGVNIGGNGTIIASLANLIAYRTYFGPRTRNVIVRFHVVSIAYLAVSSIIVALLLYAHPFSLVYL